MTLVPKTTLGKWSLGLSVSFFVSLGLLMLMAATGQEGGEKFTDNLLLAIPAFLAAVSAVGAFSTGIVGIIRKKERSILVFAATIIGLLVLLFLVGEFTTPH
jgi:hypothetical protein